MRDAVSVIRATCLHPYIRSEVPKLIESAELRLGPYAAVRIIQGLRYFETQATLYNIGRTVKGANAKPGRPMGDVVTDAKPGQSAHQYGLAIDFAILYDKDHNGTFESLSWDLVSDLNRDGEADWKEVVDVFIGAGYVWGGQWRTIKDNPHFEKTKGLTWEQMLAKYKAEDFMPAPHGMYINI